MAGADSAESADEGTTGDDELPRAGRAETSGRHSAELRQSVRRYALAADCSCVRAASLHKVPCCQPGSNKASFVSEIEPHCT